MILEQFLKDIALILSLGLLLSIVLKKQNAPIAGLITGILLSDNTLSIFNFKLIENIEAISALYFFASVLLMFIIGLNLPVTRIKKYSGTVFVVSMVEIFFLVSFFYITAVYLCKWSQLEAALLAVLLVPSGTLILLDPLTKSRKEYASIIMGIVMIENIVGVIILNILEIAIGTSLSYIDFVTYLTLLTLFIGTLMLGGSYAIPKIMDKISGNNLLIFVLGFTFLISYTGTYLKVSIIATALITGIVFASTRAKKELEDLLAPFRELIHTLFFFFIGFYLNIWSLAENFYIPFLLFSLLYFIKPITIFFSLKSLKYDTPTSLKSSSVMTNPGEVSLIFGYTVTTILGIEPRIFYYVIIMNMISMIFFNILKKFI